MRILILGMAVLLTAGLAADPDLIQPADVAAQLAAKGEHALILQVGPNFLYRAKHIPGAVYAGPAGRAEGLDLLKKAVEKLPRDREIVVYCGCCPWDKCPNVRPAMALLKQLGFTRAKAMYVEKNFATDWTEKNYPIETGQAKP